MTPADSLQLDEHLARLLAAYDQGIGAADGKAPTLGLNRPVNEGSASDLLPDTPYTPPPPPAGPHRIGRYELRRQLGKGGCGIVFLAYDPKLKREVALKIPRPEMMLSPDARRRLAREARAAAEFDHPNLVPVYEAGEVGPVSYVATAYCPGNTLADWLDRQAYPVPVRTAARLVAAVADAVQHAHDRGVLHRDLKPNNVLLMESKGFPADQGPPPGSVPLRGEHFVPRVLDFGLAKLMEPAPGETATRQVLGTPRYMAPEQAQARHEDVDVRADVYALGVMLYELLAGRPPFDGATDVEILRQAIDGRLVPPRELRADLPRDLEAICLKAMARNPARRFRTAIDLADDLRRFLDGRPTLARPLNWPGRAARWLRRNDQAVALGVVVAVALGFVAVGVWSAQETEQLRTDRDTTQAARARADLEREYARYVRDAFLAWRAGDGRAAADALGWAKGAAGMNGAPPEFAWAYLARLGRVGRAAAVCPAGPASAAAVSPDGGRVATAHADGTVAVWDRATGALLGSAADPAGGGGPVAFTTGGTGLAAVAAGGRLRLWAVGPAGVPTPGADPPAFPGPVVGLAAGPGGARLLVATAGGAVAVWDVAANRVERTWDAGGPVAAVAVSPDGATAATGGPAARLWDAATGRPLGDPHGPAAAVAVLPDGAGGGRLAAGGADGTVRVFDRAGREAWAAPAHPGGVTALAASPDGALVASGGADAGVCVWDAATGAVRARLRGHDAAVRAVRFGPDGRTLTTAADDGLLKAWDAAAEPDGTAARGLFAAATAAAAHPDGRGYAVGYADGTVEVGLDREAAPRRVPAAGRGPLAALRFPADGPPVGVELTPTAAVVWTFGDTPAAVRRVGFPDGAAPTAAALSASGNRVAVGSAAGRVTLRAVADGAEVAGFDTGGPGAVRCLAVSDDGQRVAAPAAGGQVGVWVAGAAAPAGLIPGPAGGAGVVRFFPFGDRVVVAGRGGTVRVWAVTPAREELTLLGHVGRVTAAAVAPDGRTLATGGSTGEVKLWDVRTGLELVGLRRHAGPVTAAEFAPGGALLLTAAAPPGGRGELAFWDAPRE